MKKLFLLCLGFMLTMGWSQTAVIKVDALSPHEITQQGITAERSSGLSVVGVNEIVYLVGMEAGGEQITAYQWSISSSPAGSAATLDSTTTWRTSFRPDMVGQFNITLTITTATGTDDTTITILAAKYVGVGTIGGATPSFPQCGVCHSDMVTEWEQTGHASFFTRAIDGNVSPYYAENCIECHTVGYNKNASGNDGFDDVAASEGFVFPSPLDAGNWDSLLTANPNTMQKANIQCENCHGPGSEHKGDVTKIGHTLDEGLCGQCHEEPPYHVKNIQWKNSGHGNMTTLDYAGGIDGCRSCHSGDGFLNSLDSTKYKTPMKANISCQICHDPHDATNTSQIRTVAPVTLMDNVSVFDYGLGNLCANCHRSRRNAELYAVEYHNHYGPHHGPQADMFLGKNAITWGKNLASTSAHNTALTNGCVECHMANASSEVVGEHTFAMVADTMGTPNDPTDDVYNVARCTNCHGNITTFADIKANGDYDGDGNVEPFEDEIQGLLDAIGLLLPPIGDPSVVVDTSLYNYTVLDYQAAYNYFFVEEDRSHGIHNPKFSVALLQATLDTLQKVVGIEPDFTNIPEKFELQQNFPNPFNPTTQIKFGIPYASEVRLTIFNMLGQPVKTLVNGKLQPGYYTFTWNGTDNHGNVVASGTYIYSLKTDQGLISKKMVFIK